jgi:two-component system chemotaxis response regulator CheB
MALIAPGDKHLIVKREGIHNVALLDDSQPVNRHKPSVDVLFRSVAKTFGNSALGIILTGMGADGVKGMLEMKNAGAITIAQDESTSVVFGMPKVAINRGAAQIVLPLHEIPAFINNLIQKNTALPTN